MGVFVYLLDPLGDAVHLLISWIKCLQYLHERSDAKRVRDDRALVSVVTAGWGVRARLRQWKLTPKALVDKLQDVLFDVLPSEHRSESYTAMLDAVCALLDGEAPDPRDLALRVYTARAALADASLQYKAVPRSQPMPPSRRSVAAALGSREEQGLQAAVDDLLEGVFADEQSAQHTVKKDAAKTKASAEKSAVEADTAPAITKSAVQVPKQGEKDTAKLAVKNEAKPVETPAARQPAAGAATRAEKDAKVQEKVAAETKDATGGGEAKDGQGGLKRKPKEGGKKKRIKITLE